MYTESIGETIFRMRKKRGMSRAELAEKVGISESHLSKIEAGSRKPSMETYERIMETLGAEVRLKDDETSLNGKCLAKIRESILEKTEAQALFIIGIVEYVSEYLDHISK